MDSDNPAPPSSPPLGAFNDTTTTIVPTKLSSPKSPNLPPRRRKRPRLSNEQSDQGYASASFRNGDASSDAPFFSSDDLTDADATKYTSPARKKQYRRAWYEPERSESAVSHQLMRSATRTPKDSGIYMNSDSSNSSFEEGFELETATLKAKAAQTQSKKMQAFLQGNESSHSVRSSTSPARPFHALTKLRDDELVEDRLADAVDTGREEVDLSGFDLQDLPSECFAPLRNFIKQPMFQLKRFTEAACAPLTPSLRVFLANNQLSIVPPSLFSLEHLQVLSLRTNRITELPTSIRNLRKLTEVNLNGNPLHFLPWEIRTLVRGNEPEHESYTNHLSGKGFHAQPSQMTLGPLAAEAYKRHIPSQDDLDRQWRPGLHTIARTPAALFEVDGSLHRSSPIPAPSQLTAEEVLGLLDILLAPSQIPNCLGGQRRIPSLFAQALAKCAASPAIRELPLYLPEETPATITRALEIARRVVDLEGPQGRICSVCGSRFVISRAEWVEFACHDVLSEGIPISGEENVLYYANTYPLLRRACSWVCAADAENDGKMYA